MPCAAPPQRGEQSGSDRRRRTRAFLHELCSVFSFKNHDILLLLRAFMAEKKQEKKRLLSGIQPSGRLHIGNYLGAMKQFVDLQDEYESFVSIVNYHALTTVHEPQVLSEHTIQAAIDHLAIGLDPKKVTLFVQSDVPEVTELTWIFNTLVSVSYLSRAHAYKDKIGKGLEATVGLFDYPMLMAADILLPGADVVPVGQDQKQHVEMARDVAEKFNHTFGQTFTLPQPLILPDVAVVSGTDGRKMSKSYNNTIPLFAENGEIEKQVMSIVTDSKEEFEPKDPTTCNIFALHKHFSKTELGDLKQRYIKGKIGYRESKEMLVGNLIAFITPLREKHRELEKDKDTVLKILKKGGEKAREIAVEKMKEVREKVGVSLHNS